MVQPIYRNPFHKFKVWSQQDAIMLCTKIENVCVECDCHVALTGGLLYKEGFRKDLDILFYRIRQAKQINMLDLWKNLETIGILKLGGFGCWQ